MPGKACKVLEKRPAHHDCGAFTEPLEACCIQKLRHYDRARDGARTVGPQDRSRTDHHQSPARTDDTGRLVRRVLVRGQKLESAIAGIQDIQLTQRLLLFVGEHHSPHLFTVPGVDGQHVDPEMLQRRSIEIRLQERRVTPGDVFIDIVPVSPVCRHRLEILDVGLY